MGFYNIYTEGEQAEAYKRKKEAEEAKAKEQEEKRRCRYASNEQPGARQHISGYTKLGTPITDGPTKEDKKRDKDTSKAAKRAIKGENFESPEEKEYQYNIAKDAANRHMRRHPDQWKRGHHIGPKSESGIFESIEFL